MRLLAALALTALCAAPAAAQRLEPPNIPRELDPNDWNSYYDWGVEKLRTEPSQAELAFLWASRIDPERPEPLFARYVAYWARDQYRFVKYLRNEDGVASQPGVLATDSLRLRALERNPFVHQGLTILMYDLLPGKWGDDLVTRAWIAYANGELQKAADLFGTIIQRNPKEFGYLRFVRASAFVNLGRNDSALKEVSTLLAEARARDAKFVGREYQSKELLEYATGLLYLQLRRGRDAQEAFERSVVENPAFAAGHQMLGYLAAQRRDTTVAFLEYGTAIEVDSSDAVSRLGYGNALMSGGRENDAIRQFRRAIALAPLYALPHYRLAAALEATGDTRGARAEYAEFLKRAARTNPLRAQADQQLQGLPRSPE